jgi:MinD-like ATPase involved in chromosome partitioning or flagellar assembly
MALRAEGMTVALVDADPHLGAIAVQLDLAEDRSLIYLAHEAELRTVDDDLVSRHLQSTSGLDVLTGRPVAGLGEVVSPELLGDVVGLLRRRYDVVVIDVGALACLVAQATALICQLLVWVVVPTKLGTDLLDRTLSGPLASQVRTRPSLVVLNRLGDLALRDVDSSLRRRYGMAVAAAIADQHRACVEAEDRARPAALAGPLAGPLRRCARVVAKSLARAVEVPRFSGDESRLPIATEFFRESS